MAIDVPDFDGIRRSLQTPNSNGRAAAGNSRPIVLSNEDFTAISNLATLLGQVDSHVDGLEALIAATNTKLDSLVTIGSDPTPTAVKSNGQEYEACPAGATTDLGATGNLGDVLSHIIIVPGATNCGAVSIKDGGDAAIQVFPGGSSTALTDLSARFLAFDLKSRTGKWQIVTGANVTVLAAGDFT
jgi:hypothetical protein